jgi:polyhydroxyalkanoate synthesis regulator phasin
MVLDNDELQEIVDELETRIENLEATCWRLESLISENAAECAKLNNTVSRLWDVLHAAGMLEPQTIEG